MTRAAQWDGASMLAEVKRCGHDGPAGAVCELYPHPHHAHHCGVDNKGKRRRWKVCRGCGRMVGAQKRGGLVAHYGIPGIKFRCPGDVP